jgi:hypothetical protein
MSFQIAILQISGNLYYAILQISGNNLYLQFFKSRPLACDISELPVIINKGDDERPQNKRRKRYAIILELKNLFIPCIMFCVYDISM